MSPSICLTNAKGFNSLFVTNHNTVNFYQDVKKGETVWCSGEDLPQNVVVTASLINNLGRHIACTIRIPEPNSGLSGKVLFLLPPLPSSQNTAGAGSQFMVQLSWADGNPVVSVPFFSKMRNKSNPVKSERLITSWSTRYDAVTNKTLKLAVYNTVDNVLMYFLTQYLLDVPKKKHYHFVSYHRPNLEDIIDPLVDLPDSTIYSAYDRSAGQDKNTGKGKGTSKILALDAFGPAWLKQLNKVQQAPAPVPLHAPVFMPASVTLDPQLNAAVEERVRLAAMQISQDIVKILGLSTVRGSECDNIFQEDIPMMLAKYLEMNRRAVWVPAPLQPPPPPSCRPLTPVSALTINTSKLRVGTPKRPSSIVSIPENDEAPATPIVTYLQPLVLDGTKTAPMHRQYGLRPVTQCSSNDTLCESFVSVSGGSGSSSRPSSAIQSPLGSVKRRSNSAGSPRWNDPDSFDLGEDERDSRNKLSRGQAEDVSVGFANHCSGVFMPVGESIFGEVNRPFSAVEFADADLLLGDDLESTEGSADLKSFTARASHFQHHNNSGSMPSLSRQNSEQFSDDEREDEELVSVGCSIAQALNFPRASEEPTQRRVRRPSATAASASVGSSTESLSTHSCSSEMSVRPALFFDDISSAFTKSASRRGSGASSSSAQLEHGRSVPISLMQLMSKRQKEIEVLDSIDCGFMDGAYSDSFYDHQTDSSCEGLSKK